MSNPRRLVIPALALGVLLASQLAAGVPAFATLTNTFYGTVDSSAKTGPAFKGNVFNVQEAGAINATLTWSAASATPGVKLALFLKDPTNNQVAFTQPTTTQPVTLNYNATATGNWNLGVKATGGAASYTLVIKHSPDINPPPPGIASYSSSYGYTGHAGLYAYGMGYDATDNTVLIADLWNYRVFRYTTSGSPVSTPAGGIVSHVAARGATGGIGSPFGVAADPAGNVWVADQSNSRVVEFDHNGNWLQTIGAGGGPNASDQYTVGCGNGNTTIPTHLAFDPTSGNLYVSDPRCRNVYIFNPANGSYLGQFTWPKIGMPIPRGLAIDSSGTVYVAEFNTKKIYAFDTSGNYKFTFQPSGNPTDMSDVRGLALDATNGYLYAIGAQNNKVVKFRTDGSYVATWGATVSRPFDSIRFVTTDPTGAVYVSDVYGYRVWKLDTNGNVLPWATGPQPPPNGGMNQNNGIGIDPATGNLYVVDTFENRVQRFATTNSDGSTSHCLSLNDCPAYQLSFGQRGPLSTDNSDLDYPHMVTVGGGYVWMDSPNAVLQLDMNGNYINRWGTHGKAVGQFSNGPQGMRVVPTGANTGLVYTTDVGNCRLQIFDYSGNLQSYAGSTCGSGAGQMMGPRQIDVHGNFAYVADTGNSRIDVFDITQNPPVMTSTFTVKNFLGKSLNQPKGVLVDPTGTYLYIADSNNFRIIRTHLDGSSPQLVTTGTDTPQGKLGGPEWMEWGPDGRLFVSDNNHTVYGFTINS